MSARLRKLGLWILALALVALLVVLSGVVPIKASSGHWPITEWILHSAMRRSVSAHSLFIDVPPLDDETLVLKGAVYYELGCRPCHGSPELEHPRIAARMTPSPPYLPLEIEKWDPEELFYLVKHGVKFTGMPAWPSPHRDDEVWAMVAFLRKFPELDRAQYRRLVLSDVRDRCARCHGADGHGRGEGAIPRLAGQRAQYLKNALTAYARGERHSGIMEPIASELSPELIGELAEYYARLPLPEPRAPEDAAAIARGEKIALRGVPSERIPPCAECHGPTEIRRNDAYPVLARHRRRYLILQLELLRDGRRGGSSHMRIMEPIAKRLSPEQMRDVALYYESNAGEAR